MLNRRRKNYRDPVRFSELPGRLLYREPIVEAESATNRVGTDAPGSRRIPAADSGMLPQAVAVYNRTTSEIPEYHLL